MEKNSIIPPIESRQKTAGFLPPRLRRDGINYRGMEKNGLGKKNPEKHIRVDNNIFQFGPNVKLFFAGPPPHRSSNTVRTATAISMGV